MTAIKLKPCVVSIDPGSIGIGIAVWDQPNWFDLVTPKVCCVIDYKEEVYPERIFNMCDSLYYILEPLNIWSVHIEKVGYFDSHLGQTAAKSKSLEKLVASYGAILQTIHWLGVKSEDIYEHEPNEWKGQLPKKIVEDRIKKLLPGIEKMDGLKTHAWDAVGVGLYAKGFLSQHGKQR
jgi:Holliday junction resolvasome RuvABC endonuclease subunit